MANTGLSAANIYLTGFSYTGKTTVGRTIAERLGLEYVDTDLQIELRQGKAISEIFADEGESAFRDLETAVLHDLSERSGLVVATGGGVIKDPSNRRLMAQDGIIICLDARPETILSRMRADQSDDTERPLLAHANPLRQIEALKAGRQRHYAIADWTVQTDSLSLEEVAVEAIRGAEIGLRRLQAGAPLETASTLAEQEAAAYTVRTETATYPIVVGAGLIASLGSRMKELGLVGQAHVIVDASVAGSLGEASLKSLQRAGITSRLFTVPSGETSKNLEHAEALYAWLAEGRAERRDAVIALGGGVVGDLAGFVAATYVRGLSFVQVPTTLLAMVDASIGGKVAIDLPVGKNLVGAFHQPALVLTDIKNLATLPERDLRAGWAEVLKTGLVLDQDLVSYLEEKSDDLQSGNEEAVTHAVARCAAIKGSVVSLDEHETTGLRARLNYGHTLGHALEAAAGYTGLLHGEAVAIGMSFAAELALRAGLLTQSDKDRHDRLLERFGLLTTPPQGIDRAAVLNALSLDKKAAEGRIRWVLLDSVGHGLLRSDVSQEIVDETLDAFLAGRLS